MLRNRMKAQSRRNQSCSIHSSETIDLHKVLRIDVSIILLENSNVVNRR
jgi:hypothetical protein